MKNLNKDYQRHFGVKNWWHLAWKVLFDRKEVISKVMNIKAKTVALTEETLFSEFEYKLRYIQRSREQESFVLPHFIKEEPLIIMPIMNPSFMATDPSRAFAFKEKTFELNEVNVTYRQSDDLYRLNRSYWHKILANELAMKLVEKHYIDFKFQDNTIIAFLKVYNKSK